MRHPALAPLPFRAPRPRRLTRARPAPLPTFARRAEVDVYAPIQLPSVESIRAGNTLATKISRSPGGPLIVEYVSTARARARAHAQ